MNKSFPFYSNSSSLFNATFSLFLFYFSFFRLGFNRQILLDLARATLNPRSTTARECMAAILADQRQRSERLIERRHAQLDPRKCLSINKSHIAVVGDCSFTVNFAPLVNATRILDILPLLIQKD